MSRNRLFAFAAACVLAGSTRVQASDGSIAVYLDDGGTQCRGNVAGGPTSGSIWMNLAGATAGGITGVEFRVDNSSPSSYMVSGNASPDANLVIGDPFFLGVNEAFQTCQAGPRVKLFSLFIMEQSHNPDVTLTVRQRYEPTNYQYPCVLAVLCDAPVYTTVCVGAPNSDHWRAVINPSAGVSGDCQPVAVQPTSWSTVKALYRR